MTCRIYKITNDINDKIYVGQTSKTLEERFSEHKKDRMRRGFEKRPLYHAMNKYGIEHFSISLIEECSSQEVAERETYWIEFYHGYSQGYNATLGGDGTCLYDHDKIADLLLQGYNRKEIASIIGCCPDIVSNVSHSYGIPIQVKENSLMKEMRESKIPVKQFDLQENYIQSFVSYAEAARWLENNGYVKGNLSGVRTKIGEVCTGKRKTAYKFIWRKSDESI